MSAWVIPLVYTHEETLRRLHTQEWPMPFELRQALVAMMRRFAAEDRQAEYVRREKAVEDEREDRIHLVRDTLIMNLEDDHKAFAAFELIVEELRYCLDNLEACC